MKNLRTDLEKQIMDVGKDPKMTSKLAEEKYKAYEENMKKYSDEIPKIEQLERDLELLENKDSHDDEFIGNIESMQKAETKSKELVKARENKQE